MLDDEPVATRVAAAVGRTIGQAVRASTIARARAMMGRRPAHGGTPLTWIASSGRLGWGPGGWHSGPP
eukprot:849996-Pyramimonas_sp.AAC.1